MDQGTSDLILREGGHSLARPVFGLVAHVMETAESVRIMSVRAFGDLTMGGFDPIEKIIQRICSGLFVHRFKEIEEGVWKKVPLPVRSFTSSSSLA